MDNFVNMSINNFLELQEDIKFIKEYNEKLEDTNREDFFRFKDSSRFFNLISFEIEMKFKEVYYNYDTEDDY